MDYLQEAPRLLTTRYQFEDIHARIGERFQLEAHELPLERHYGVLVGYAPWQSLLVKTPYVAGLPVPYRDGQALTVRAFTGLGVFAFDSAVQRVCVSPFHYLHLGYPIEVRGTQIRASERVKVNMPTQVSREGDLTPGVISDIGIGGAMLECGLVLNIGDVLQVQVTFALEQMQVKAGFEVLATVHRALPAATDAQPGMMHCYGLEFSNLSIGQRIMLQNFVYHCLLEDQHSLV